MVKLSLICILHIESDRQFLNYLCDFELFSSCTITFYVHLARCNINRCGGCLVHFADSTKLNERFEHRIACYRGRGKFFGKRREDQSVAHEGGTIQIILDFENQHVPGLREKFSELLPISVAIGSVQFIL